MKRIVHAIARSAIGAASRSGDVITCQTGTVESLEYHKTGGVDLDLKKSSKTTFTVVNPWEEDIAIGDHLLLGELDDRRWTVIRKECG